MTFIKIIIIYIEVQFNISFLRVPGAVSETPPSTATGEATPSDCNEGGEEAKSAEAASAVGRKLSKVGLRKLKIW